MKKRGWCDVDVDNGFTDEDKIVSEFQNGEKKQGFWRQLLGPSQEEVWRQLSDEISANYVGGGFWERGKVQARHGHWVVTLDSYSVSTGNAAVHYTRMRAPFVNALDPFRFTVYRRGFLSDLATKFGMQDVIVGYEQFDRDFVIQGTSESKLRALFASETLRELISIQPGIVLSVKDDEGCFAQDFPEGVDELHFQVGGVITDIERLKCLFDLFAVTLEQLHRIGSAARQDPRVRL